MTKRPILVALIGYIIGIIEGLYLQISIAQIYIILVAIHIIIKKTHKKEKAKLKIFSIQRYFRYIKIIFNQKVISILLISSIISNSIILVQNQKYKLLYKDIQEINLTGTIISNKEEKEYKDIYCIKVERLNNSKKYKNTKLLLKVDKKSEKSFKCGNKITIKGKFIEPNGQRNYGGFNYKEYLKTKGIYGLIDVEKVNKVESNKNNDISNFFNNISLNLRNTIDNMLEKEQASILKGLILGDTSNIEENVYEKFQISNMSHILAVSGMHISYIILGINIILKNKVGKRKTKYVIIMLLIFYMLICGISPSMVRATIMGIIVTMSGLLYRKSDIWTSISLSLLIILIYNPFLIQNIGLQLSYLGTIGIILLYKNVFEILKSIKLKNNKHQFNKKRIIVISKIKEILSVTFSVQIIILPIVLYQFNFLGIYFILTSLITSIIVEPIVFLGIISIILYIIINPVGKIFCLLLQILIDLLIKISDLSNLPYAKIYIPTPKIWIIVLYYLIIFLSNYIYSIYHKRNINLTQRRFRNLIELLKYKKRNSRLNYKIFIVFIIISIALYKLTPNNLEIYFVDVGQGDCTFIRTPTNRTILIDGGGSRSKEFDVGKKTLLPYILDRGYTKIDYVIISHYDQDHVGGILTIINELKVKNIIIGKQFEDSENYKKFIEIVQLKKINVKVIERGERINIENDLCLDILWPDSKNKITENALNNNSLVFKLIYKNFSIMFTGDIEKIAEEKILEKIDNNLLKSDILKVAHHGSKTSSIQEFIEKVKPKIILIGVGENNMFGHPNKEVLERLKKMSTKIYRTDQNGEITISINSKGKINFINKIYNN